MTCLLIVLMMQNSSIVNLVADRINSEDIESQRPKDMWEQERFLYL